MPKTAVMFAVKSHPVCYTLKMKVKVSYFYLEISPDLHPKKRRLSKYRKRKKKIFYFPECTDNFRTGRHLPRILISKGPY